MPKHNATTPLRNMDDGAKLWMMKYARKNFWRVAGWYDLDDLFQDGHMTYQRIVEKYCFPWRSYITQYGQKMPPRRKAKPVKDRAHLMALFKLAFCQHIHMLARQRTDAPETVASDLIPPDAHHDWLWERLMPEEGNLALFIAQAPPLVQAAVRALEDADGPALRARYRVRPGGREETFNDRLCRLVGLDPSDVDLVVELTMYLKKQPSMI